MNEDTYFNNELPQKADRTELSDLNDKELRAVEMRWKGESYAEIAETTGWHVGHCRKLFALGGRLSLAYEQFAEKQRLGPVTDRVQRSIDLAKEKSLTAMEILIREVQNPENTPLERLKAVDMILKISGVDQQTALRSFLSSKTHDQAQRMMDDLFMSVFGKGISITYQSPTITRFMPDGTTKELEFNIGDKAKTSETLLKRFNNVTNNIEPTPQPEDKPKEGV